MTFHFDAAPKDLLVKKDPVIATFTEQYSKYYDHLSPQLPTTGNTFLTRLDPVAMGTRDVRTTKYCAEIIDGAGTAWVP